MAPARLPGSLVGRDRKVALLRASLDTARSGRPSITLVVGEAGIGKTRLVDEDAAIARAGGMRVLRGGADRTWREPMELWRGVHRSLGIEPFRDLTVPAEVRRRDHLESLPDALCASGTRQHGGHHDHHAERPDHRAARPPAGR